MSLFGSIVEKIVHYASTAIEGGAAKPAATAPAVGAAETATGAAPTAAAPAAAPTAAPAAPAVTTQQSLQSVDVGAVLDALEQKKGGGLNWQSSIVDLLKLLDLDSSLQARKQLAQELDVHVAEDGSAEQNVALHKAVLAKLAENGGKLPASLQG